MKGNEDDFGLGDIQFDDILDDVGVEEPAGDDTPPAGGDEGKETIENVSDEAPGEEPEGSEGDANDDPDEGDEGDQRKEKGGPETTEEEEEDGKEDEGEEDPASEGGESTVVGEVLQSLGFEMPETPYEDTPEGLAQMVQDVGNQMAMEQMQEVFDRYPLIQKHFEYVQNGGRSDEFIKAFDGTRDYDKLELSEDDTAMHRQVLSDYLTKKGHDRDFIEDMLKDYDDSERLYEKATKAHAALKKGQAEERKQLLEQQKAQKAQAEKERQEFWEGMYDAIDKTDELAGIQLPKRDKSRFFEYISKPVTRDGRTQRDIDHAEAEMPMRLAIDYLMFKGFDVSTLMGKKKATKKVQTLKERMEKGGSRKLKSGKGPSKREGTGIDLEQIDYNLDAIL